VYWTGSRSAASRLRYLVIKLRGNNEGEDNEMLGKIKAKRHAFKSAVKAKRAERKYNKEIEKMKRIPKKPIVASKTTQNMGAGVAVSGGSAVGIITFVRAMFPDILPWGAEHDTAIAA